MTATQGETRPQGGFMAEARRAIDYFSAKGYPFGADQVRDWCEAAFVTPDSPFAYGAAFQSAAHDGIITRSGVFRAMRGDRAHGRRTELWIGSKVAQDRDVARELELRRVHEAILSLAVALRYTGISPRGTTEAGGREALVTALAVAREVEQGKIRLTTPGAGSDVGRPSPDAPRGGAS